MSCLPKLTLSSEVEAFLKQSFLSKQPEGTSDNDKWFETLLGCLGRPPLFTTVRANTLHSSVEDVKKQLEQVLKKTYLNKNSGCPPVHCHHILPDVLVIPGSGPRHDIQAVKKEIIVDVFCGTAVLRGADVFAPGVMGTHPGIQKGDEVSVLADLDKQCSKGFAKPYCGKTLFVGNGVALMGRSDLFCAKKNISGVAVKMTNPLYNCPPLNGILPNLMFLQNLPSTVVGHVLDPQPGEMVLDMCAAPGGKTTHLATLMTDKGLVVAFDKSLRKVQKIKTNCEIQNISIVKPYVFDAVKSLDEAIERLHHHDGCCLGSPPYPPGVFGRILLDAPCSALGQRPQSIVRMSLKELQSFPKLQRKLFSSAVGLLKDGGVLVYSTCTITTHENEEQVAWVLNTFPCLQLAAQNPHIGGPGLENCGLTEAERRLVQRFDPSVLHGDAAAISSPCDVDTIGFFIAKFVKKS